MLYRINAVVSSFKFVKHFYLSTEYGTEINLPVYWIVVDHKKSHPINATLDTRNKDTKSESKDSQQLDHKRVRSHENLDFGRTSSTKSFGISLYSQVSWRYWNFFSRQKSSNFDSFWLHPYNIKISQSHCTIHAAAFFYCVTNTGSLFGRYWSLKAFSVEDESSLVSDSFLV